MMSELGRHAPHSPTQTSLHRNGSLTRPPIGPYAGSGQEGQWRDAAPSNPPYQNIINVHLPQTNRETANRKLKGRRHVAPDPDSYSDSDSDYRSQWSSDDSFSHRRGDSVLSTPPSSPESVKSTHWVSKSGEKPNRESGHRESQHDFDRSRNSTPGTFIGGIPIGHQSRISRDLSKDPHSPRHVDQRRHSEALQQGFRHMRVNDTLPRSHEADDYPWNPNCSGMRKQVKFASTEYDREERIRRRQAELLGSSRSY